MALQPETRIAKQEGEGSRQGAAQRYPGPRRDAVIDKQDGRRVSASAEIEPVAERDLSAISAKDVPGLRHGGVNQKQDQDVEQVDVGNAGWKGGKGREHDSGRDG